IARFARGADEYRAMLDTYRARQDELHDTLLQPFPGAAETVAELARRGIRLALVTSKLRRSTLRGMDRCGITEHFEVIVTPEDVRNPKPHPEPVRVALQRLGVDASEAVFVGDSPHDMASGRAAGTRTAAALWGPFPRETLLAERPDVLLHRQEDVLDLVGR
ncbi:MAG TPA: HAD-IA family hydrolase, partial [Longimicrobium sp.]|nr:HAD-IA family hydrolase [Longimicrobium sp.]